jgi:hypothetical protein
MASVCDITRMPAVSNVNERKFALRWYIELRKTAQIYGGSNGLRRILLGFLGFVGINRVSPFACMDIDPGTADVDAKTHEMTETSDGVVPPFASEYKIPCWCGCKLVTTIVIASPQSHTSLSFAKSLSKSSKGRFRRVLFTGYRNISHLP